MNKYSKLEATNDYDQETVEQLAEAMTELRQLKARELYLEELIGDHPELHQFIWGTAEGRLLPYHKIEDDHLKNIMQHCINMGRSIPKGIKAEARKRDIEVPDDSTAVLYAKRQNLIEAELVDRDDFLDA